MAHGDVGGVERGIVSGVVAVGAGALAVKDVDLRGGEPERAGQPFAQHRGALGMRPDLQRAVVPLSERAGRPDRGVGEEGPRIGGLDHAALRRAARRAGVGGLVARGLTLQPVRRADIGRRDAAALPTGQRAGGCRCARHRKLAVRCERHKLAVADDLDCATGSLAHCALVERRQMRAAPGLAQHACMQDMAGRDVVDEARARDLGRQVEPRPMLADDLVGRGPLDRRGAGGAALQRDLSRHRPIVAAGVLAGAEEPAVLDRKLARRATQRLGETIDEQRAHLGADQADRGAADRDRIAAGGEALGGADVGLARHQIDLLGADVEFFGGDLGERGQDALADLDLAGADADAAGLGERDPLRQDRIVDQALRQRVGNHRRAPAMAAPARCTARITRFWMPQRQRCGSSASMMSARLGVGFVSSSAVAEMTMPGRQ